MSAMGNSPQTSKAPSHTPGPWGISLEGRSRLLVNDATARHTTICQVMAGYVGDKEARANANLLAAAPDLLASLKVMEAWTAHAFDADDPDMDLPELEQARAAIAKAEGQAQLYPTEPA